MINVSIALPPQVLPALIEAMKHAGLGNYSLNINNEETSSISTSDDDKDVIRPATETTETTESTAHRARDPRESITIEKIADLVSMLYNEGAFVFPSDNSKPIYLQSNSFNIDPTNPLVFILNGEVIDGTKLLMGNLPEGTQKIHLRRLECCLLMNDPQALTGRRLNLENAGSRSEIDIKFMYNNATTLVKGHEFTFQDMLDKALELTTRPINKAA